MLKRNCNRACFQIFLITFLLFKVFLKEDPSSSKHIEIFLLWKSMIGNAEKHDYECPGLIE